MCELIINK